MFAKATAGDRRVFTFGVFRLALGPFEYDNHGGAFIALGTERTSPRSSSDRVEDE